MTIVFLTAAILMLVVGIMSIGVIMGREPIKGSCGGMSALGMETACEVCGGDQTRCDKSTDADQAADSDLAYEASSSEQAR